MRHDQVEVTLINARGGEIIEQLVMSVNDLPDTFEGETTLHLDEQVWVVTSAEPLTATEFAESGKLILTIRRDRNAGTKKTEPMDFSAFQRRFEKLRTRKVFSFREPDPKARDTEIQEAEWRLGCKLGAKYVAFLRQYGGGHMGSEMICSVHPGSDANIVSENERAGLLPRGFLAFSPNGCGDYYGFQIQDGIAADTVLFHDHETDAIEDSGYADIFRYILAACDNE